MAFLWRQCHLRRRRMGMRVWGRFRSPGLAAGGRRRDEVMVNDAGRKVDSLADPYLPLDTLNLRKWRADDGEQEEGREQGKYEKVNAQRREGAKMPRGKGAREARSGWGRWLLHLGVFLRDQN